MIWGRQGGWRILEKELTDFHKRGGFKRGEDGVFFIRVQDNGKLIDVQPFEGEYFDRIAAEAKVRDNVVPR